ncbi:hypothetical protein BD410DRAFT_327703 [Rickenella mellea]|uniref:Uncharacterized protein n=1 Tax=Rickenella mellea TaxID=50990 RepID=A0A4Y7QLF2_9AGAM|nr:hypothetical protein BD410DRAFT_327703 [Rickenella mellea]
MTSIDRLKLVKRLTEVNKILTERRKSLRRAATRKMQQGQHNQLAKKLADEVDTTDARNEILRDIETADSTFLTDAQNLTLDESTRCADHIAAFMTLPAAELKVYWMKWAEQQQSASNCADSDDEPDHDHEHFRSAIRSARDALGDGKEPLHNAQRATHAPHNSNIAPGEDEDQISLGDGVERQGEPDLIQLDIAILKRRMVEYICAPVFEERREREEFKVGQRVSLH